MKLYVVSGLGADFKVLEKIQFPANLEVVFLDWLVPKTAETLADYVRRMSEKIDVSEEFCLLGYSFGGIVVQEIDRLKPAKKVVILGSIKSDAEKSKFIKFGEITHIPQYLPHNIFNSKSAIAYAFIRRIFSPQNPRMLEYFTVRHPYYLKWSIQRISEWKFEENSKVIQILGDKDVVFPIKNSKPDFIIPGGTHLFPATRPKEVSKILNKVFSEG